MKSVTVPKSDIFVHESVCPKYRQCVIDAGAKDIGIRIPISETADTILVPVRWLSHWLSHRVNTLLV